jgi:hypothetical protein
MTFDLKKLQNYAFSPSGLIFDQDSGSIFTTNQIGLSILTHLKAGADLEETRRRLTAEFEVPDSTVLARDVDDFLNQLLSLGILEQTDA